MARIRAVHPSLFTDEAWVSCGPLARILYIGLWTDADDQGLFEWKPLQIKMRLLPGDTGDVAAMLSELEEAGLIRAYEVGGKRFGAIANFRKFQRPQKPNAIHPITEIIAEYVAMPSADTTPVSDQYDTAPVISQPMEDVGVEEKKKALSPKPTKATYPEDFEAAWKAYPHTDGRSSKRDTMTEWRKLSPEDRLTLPVAAARYRRLGKEPKMDCGAPAMERWLKRGLHQHWAADPDEPRQADDGQTDPAVAARRLRHLRDTGAWGPTWGPKPVLPIANDGQARGAAA